MKSLGISDEGLRRIAKTVRSLSFYNGDWYNKVFEIPKNVKWVCATWMPTDDSDPLRPVDEVYKVYEEYVQEIFDALQAEYEEDMQSGYEENWEEPPDINAVAENVELRGYTSSRELVWSSVYGKIEDDGDFR